MIQADSVLSTPPTNTSPPTPQSSRRGFLVQATAVAAGGAAIGAGLPLPAPSTATVQSSGAEADPIFALIAAHRRAIAASNDAVATEINLDACLAAERRRSRITAQGETIVESDDPRWLAAGRARMEAWNSVDDSAIALLNIEPTTLAGIEALLRHFSGLEGWCYPEEVSNDDGSVETFGTFLVRHAADALRKIA
jgi:hypothetical protein